MGFQVMIPARYESSRLPGKPLLDLHGRPLIQHVFEQARQSRADAVTIVTDDDRIRHKAETFGASVCMTSKQHRSGTDRLAEAAEILGLAEDQIVVNLQGDEPMMPPALINQVGDMLAHRSEAEMATLCELIQDRESVTDPHVVKVVSDNLGYALYFSRAPIPWSRDESNSGDTTGYYRHIGLYAYRVSMLHRFVQWPYSRIEGLERLEQLRVLANGGKILVAKAVKSSGIGVDTEEDLEHVKVLLSRDKL